MKNYILDSKVFIEYAEQELLSANGDEKKVRQSAEKGWLAAVLAANALLQKRGIKIPKGTRKREDLLFELEKKEKKMQELSIGEKYGFFLRSLHIDCFYDGEVSIKRVKRDLRKVKEFIAIIEKL